MMRSLFGLIRYVAGFGVAASALLAALLFVTTTVQSVLLVAEAAPEIAKEPTLKLLLIAGIELADALLVATGLLLVAIGLYTLFIGKLEQLPEWLHIDSFDSLKNKLVSLVVAAMAVRFFSIVMEGHSAPDALIYGGAIAVVLLGLAAYQIAGAASDKMKSESSHGDDDHAPKSPRRFT